MVYFLLTLDYRRAGGQLGARIWKTQGKRTELLEIDRRHTAKIGTATRREHWQHVTYPLRARTCQHGEEHSLKHHARKPLSSIGIAHRHKTLLHPIT